MNRLIWAGNVLFIAAIAILGFLPTPGPAEVDPPATVPRYPQTDDDVDFGSFASMRNPLKEGVTPVQDERVYLIGTLADTAYLFLARRQAYVNAYLDEPVGVGELNGWTLRGVTCRTASFETPSGGRVLRLRE